MPKFEVLIDGSHLAYRAHHVFRMLRTTTNQATGLIYGFLKSLRSLKQRFKPKGGDLVVFWDDQPIIKKSIFAEYKAHRNKEGFSEFSSQLEILTDILRYLGVRQARLEFEEADDLISSFIEKYRKDVKKFVIISADKDFLQLVDPQVLVIKPKMGKKDEVIYSEQKVLDEFGLLPQGIIFLKVFTGDRSDNIPGVSRLPKKQVVKILKHVSLNGSSTIDQIYTQLESFDFLTKNQMTKISDFMEQAYKNFELIKLKEYVDVSVNHSDFDAESLKDSLQMLEMFDLLKHFQQWESLFGAQE